MGPRAGLAQGVDLRVGCAGLAVKALADQGAGAIQNEAGSTLVVRQSSFSGNTATFGAAVENQESAEFENVTVSGNGAGSGGKAPKPGK